MPRRKQPKRMTVQDIRTILRLTHEQGLSVREVGLRLKLSKTTVATYLHRAREAGLNCWPLPSGRDDDATLRMLGAPGGQSYGAGLPVNRYTQFALADDEHIACIKQSAFLIERFDVGAQDACRPDFAKPLDCVERLARRNAKHGQSLQGIGKISKPRFEPDAQGAGSVIEQFTRGLKMTLA